VYQNSLNPMEYLTNPLFGLVTFLIGLLTGLVLGRYSKEKEWSKREQLLRETRGCWIRGQVDLTSDEASHDT